MFYEEKVIDGVLCYRGQPNGMWTQFNAKQLTELLITSRETCNGLQSGEVFTHY